MIAIALLVSSLLGLIGPSPISAIGGRVVDHAEKLMRCYNHAAVEVPANAGTFEGYLRGTPAK